MSSTKSFYKYQIEYQELRGEAEETHNIKPDKLIVNSTDGLLDRLLKRTSNAHNLANALHRTAEQLAHAAKLFEIPARELHHHVVETGLEACAGNFCDRVLDLVEWNTKTKLSGDERERIAGRF